jgi:hypothetical protein
MLFAQNISRSGQSSSVNIHSFAFVFVLFFVHFRKAVNRADFYKKTSFLPAIRALSAAVSDPPQYLYYD